MLDDYQISQDRDLPKEAWDFMREKGFLGMVIPQEYGERLACLTWWTFSKHQSPGSVLSNIQTIFRCIGVDFQHPLCRQPVNLGYELG